MDAVSESHTYFGTRFPRQKLMPYLRILIATNDGPPAAIRYAKNPTFFGNMTAVVYRGFLGGRSIPSFFMR
jgi:hypothetical protein